MRLPYCADILSPDMVLSYSESRMRSAVIRNCNCDKMQIETRITKRACLAGKPFIVAVIVSGGDGVVCCESA